jgi:integrase/recombinase XerD
MSDVWYTVPMDTSLTILHPNQLETATTNRIPALFGNVGDQAAFRFIEFFTATIRNQNTRVAYFQAVSRFGTWCEMRNIELEHINPVHVAMYIEELGKEVSIPTVKQHLSAISKLFDFLVTGHIVRINPAHSVTAPKYQVTHGKTPVLKAEEARILIDSIDTTKIAGLRDRAIIGIMVYSFARVGAVLRMNVGDYFLKGKRWWIRLHEKGGKYHEMPLHHKAEEYLDAYVEAASLGENKKEPLFRSLNSNRTLTDNRLDRRDCWEMVKRRARNAHLPDGICNHTFRGTGITVFLENGGKLEDAQRMANHASSKTTKLYDRRSDDVTVEMVELVRI